MEDILQCHICLDELKEPKMLPCQHTYCRVCLERMVSGRRVRCGDCRESYAVPASGVHGFPNNRIVMQLLEVQNDFTSFPAAKVLCQNCKENKIYDECQHCNKIVCGVCFLGHTKLLGNTLGVKASHLGEIVDDKQVVVDEEEKALAEQREEEKSNLTNVRTAITNWRDECLRNVRTTTERMLKKVVESKSVNNPQYSRFKKSLESMKNSHRIAKMQSDDISELTRADASTKQAQKQALELITQREEWIESECKMTYEAKERPKQFFAFRKDQADEILKSMKELDGVYETRSAPPLYQEPTSFEAGHQEAGRGELWDICPVIWRR